MNRKEFVDKMTDDLTEVLESIKLHKGEKFYELLVMHLNFRSLATALEIHEEHPKDRQIWDAIKHLALMSTAQAMARMIHLSKLEKQETEELIQWGKRINKLVLKNIDQLKASK